MSNADVRHRVSNLPADPRLVRTRERMKELDAFHITEAKLNRGPLLLPEIPFSDELRNKAREQLAEKLNREPTDAEVIAFVDKYEAWKKKGGL